MRFASIIASSLLAWCATALPAPAPAPADHHVEKRDVTNIINGLSLIDTRIKALNTSVNNFQPVALSTVGGILDVLHSSDQLGDSIISATNTVKSAPTFSFDDSISVFQYVTLPLEQDIVSLLKNLAASRPKFNDVALLISVRKTVLQALVLDRQLTAGLASAITGKLYNQNLMGAGKVISNSIDGFFQTAIAAYNETESGLELPAIPSKVQNGQVVNL